ncbi:MAG TPA: hypothetical protein VGK99_09075 [Acidobacteriota bacterium]|jgi:metal-responsive CopG/Arc/MetJ family transcriptional regulator
MKRINVILSDELAERVEAVAAQKELAVAELVRRGLEDYLSRYPRRSRRVAKLPVFELGKLRVRDIKRALYEKRAAGLLE